MGRARAVETTHSRARKRPAPIIRHMEKPNPDGTRAVFKMEVFDLAKMDRTWSPAKAAAVATKMIKATNADHSALPSALLTDVTTLVFNPTRDTRLRLLKKYAVAEGFPLDQTLEGLLDQMADHQTFTAKLAKMIDPETGEPVVVRKTKRNPKDGLDALFE